MSLGRLLQTVPQGVQKDLQFTASVFPLGIARYMLHVRSTGQFFADADSGTLPSFSIVDPDFDTYSEENPQDIRKGESFAAEVINRVMHGKGWPRTLLIWVYDGHGGYHDHVLPPAAVPPDEVEGRSLIHRAGCGDVAARYAGPHWAPRLPPPSLPEPGLKWGSW
jgi:phospholipase C